MFVASELHKKLKGLAIGVCAPIYYRQSHCLVFYNNQAYTFSGNILVMFKYPFGITGAVDYKLFMNVLDKFGEREVEIKTDNDTLVVSCVETDKKNAIVRIKLDSIVSLPVRQLPEPESDKWIKVSEDFKNAVRRCEGVLKTVNADTVLSSINIDLDKIEGASKIEIVRCYLNSPFECRFLVRGGILTAIFTKEILKMQYQPQWLFFEEKDKEVFYAVPIAYDEYIDVNNFFKPVSEVYTFPNTQITEELKLSKSVLRSLDKVKVEVIAEQGICRMSCNTELGQFKSVVPMNSKTSITFYVDLNIWQKIMKDFSSCTIALNDGIHIDEPSISYVAAIDSEPSNPLKNDATQNNNTETTQEEYDDGVANNEVGSVMDIETDTFIGIDGVY